MDKNDIMRKIRKPFFINRKTKCLSVLLVGIEKIDMTSDITIYDANPLWEE